MRTRKMEVEVKDYTNKKKLFKRNNANSNLSENK